MRCQDISLIDHHDGLSFRSDGVSDHGASRGSVIHDFFLAILVIEKGRNRDR